MKPWKKQQEKNSEENITRSIKMKKNMVSKVIVSLSALLALSACNGKQTAATASTNAAPTTAVTTTAAGASASTKSSSAKTTSASTSSSGVSLSSVYDKMISDVKFPTEMLKMDDEYLEMQFGFNAADFDEYVYAQGEDTLLAETILLIKVKDSKNVNTVKESLENYLSDQTTLLNSYVPEQGKIAEKSVVGVKGNCVYLLMSSQVASLKKIAADMIK